MTGRSMFNALLALGGLRVPVKFYAALDDRSIHFRLLHAADREPVVQELIDKTTEEPVGRDEVQKAYELEDGRLVKLNAEELDSLAPAASRELSVKHLVEENTIAPALYERPYFLGPDGDDEAYFSVAHAFRQSKRVGLLRWTMRKRSHFGVLRERDGYLMAVTLRPPSEIVDVGSLSRPANKELSKQELQLARQLVDAYSGRFDAKSFHDDYRARVEELAKRKASGQVIAFPTTKRKGPTAIGLTDALEKSLKSAKKRSA